MTDVKKYAVQCLQDEAKALLDLIPLLDDNFDKAVDLMFHCKGKVIVTGVGKSGHIGAKIAATLASTGTPSFFINPLDAFHGDLGAMTKDDVVLALSNSGMTDELLRFIPILQKENIPVIGMSSAPDSLLGKNSTCHINVRVEREACPLGLAPTSSTTAALAMGDALAIAIMETRHFRKENFAQFHPGGSLGRRLLTRACDVMHTDDMPTLSPDTKLGEAIIEVSEKKLGLGIAIEKDVVVGIITDGDIRRAMEKYKKEFFDRPVSDIMTRTPKSVAPDTKITKIQEIMNQHKVHSVLVTDAENHLLGVVDHYGCFLS